MNMSHTMRPANQWTTQSFLKAADHKKTKEPEESLFLVGKVPYMGFEKNINRKTTEGRSNELCCRRICFIYNLGFPVAAKKGT